jgi:hypothetical protein
MKYDLSSNELGDAARYLKAMARTGRSLPRLRGFALENAIFEIF